MNPDEIGKYLEEYDYDYFLNSALERVPEGIDTREGSIIYDALAPASYQLAEFMLELKKVLLETFLLTASGIYLDYRAKETGIYRIKATKAVVKARFKNELGSAFNLAIGSRFSSVGEEPIYYTVVASENEPGVYRMQAETEGDRGNEYIGVLLPIDNFNGLGEATLIDVVIPARNTETDDDLRLRVIDAKEVVTFGGNIADYYNLTARIEGVGAVQVYPVWKGGGTVRLVILDNEYRAASRTLIDNVQAIIDPAQDAQGLGYAPIGHKVTVATPQAKIIDVSFDLTLNAGVLIPQVETQIKTVIKNYFDATRKKWDVRLENGYESWVFRSQIIASILTVEGVANVQKLTLNGSESDIMMTLTNDLQELSILGKVVIL
ncbi:baseplate J/gp47 family protein [Vagococcus salmoninarum]|uniref:baseplate J/gp47 family protein n=1 Tax=Vagococcus salmoninarum TaxID=2739 RepID=UPI00187FBD8C|nr:baseplate J/gp47 family protein [Vagococcus salmoninarum]MBE9390002.1 baseplate J/gp47 family protein [Vagococcus salmoninarum]